MSAATSPSRILACGAVSPAGWGCEALLAAVLDGAPLPVIQPECEPGKSGVLGLCRRVPSPSPAWVPKGQRFRRCSPVTRFAAAAAQEALDRAGLKPERLGIVMCLMNGCLNFSNRFYSEVLVDVAHASPIIFPETVFNAPASHVAAHLGADGPVTTLIGDSDILVSGYEMAEDWLASGVITHCLVIAAEEYDWLSANGAHYHHRGIIASEGAAALLLGAGGAGPAVQQVVGPIAYHTQAERVQAVAAMAQALHWHSADWLIDDGIGLTALDRAESEAWAGCSPSLRLSPKCILGHTLGAAPAFQMVVAAELARQRQVRVAVSMPGNNTAATGCIIGC